LYQDKTSIGLIALSKPASFQRDRFDPLRTRKELMMIIDNQARRLLRSAAFSAALLLMAASPALADPQEYALMNSRPAAAAVVNTLPPVELRNAPKPDADFLFSSRTWDALGGSSPTVRQTEALGVPASGP
jgi:hypothetical protein